MRIATKIESTEATRDGFQRFTQIITMDSK